MSYPINKSHPLKDFGPSLARQSELKSADINVIMAKYVKTGVLPPATRQGFFADVSSIGDYREALARVERADAFFVHLPSDVKKRFEHDPAKFLDFVSNPANVGELEDMGLVAKTAKDVPVEPKPGEKYEVEPVEGVPDSPE